MDIDELEDEIARLSARPYAEIGVPMYIVPENLCDGAPTPAPGAVRRDLPPARSLTARRDGDLQPVPAGKDAPPSDREKAPAPATSAPSGPSAAGVTPAKTPAEGNGSRADN